MAAHPVPRNALLVCFGCQSKVDTLSGIAGLGVVRKVRAQNAALFCLGDQATQVPAVLARPSTGALEQLQSLDCWLPII